MTQETNMLLRNTLAEEGRPVNTGADTTVAAAYAATRRPPEVPTGVVPRMTATEVAHRNTDQLARELQPGHVVEQPAPTPNAHPAVWPLVMVDMASRDHLGRKRYGTPLQPHNGRDTLRDAYEEALDLAVYLRTAIYERDGK